MRPSFVRRRRANVLAAAVLVVGVALLFWTTRVGDDDTAVAPSPPPGPVASASVGDAGPTTAAGRFLVALGEGSTNPAQRAKALGMIAPSAGDLVGQASAGFALLDGEVSAARSVVPNGRVLVRMVPVVYRPADCAPQRCQVSVWTLGIVAIEGRSEATETWQTNVIDLQHDGSEWLVVGWKVLPGPVPTITARRPTPTAELLSTIGDWKAFDHATID